MAVEEKAKKRRRKNNNFQSVEQTNDLLSSLHDDILIVIISCLPLRSAVVTGLLSHRWRGLWKNISSIIMTDPKSDYNFLFSDVFLNVMMQIKSSFIHRFHLVFEARSLVSISLDSTFRWELPIGADSIILPNLKSLSLHFRYFNCECLGKLIKSCLSLEELSLKCVDNSSNGYLKCSNQNLRRLFINWRSEGKIKIVINAPKLEYLNICAPVAAVICLEEEPIALREAKLQISEKHYRLDDEEKKLKSKFYEAISSVGLITLDVAFCNVTRLTLNIKNYVDTLDTNLVLSLLKLCPVLDVFALKLEDVYTNTKNIPWLKLPSHSRRSSTLHRVLKRVEVEIDWWDYRVPSKYFVELVGFLLLSNTIDSEHFHFRLRAVRYCKKETVERIKKNGNRFMQDISSSSNGFKGT
ncbi:F-box/LRR-repeat protein At3g26922-like [Silene latifolia]|uniref:F-box/LRR-repeat protein At3g26922-like n=1 Tax=Silene latifolia TaxID=37657 RepID=UPI003D76FE65